MSTIHSNASHTLLKSSFSSQQFDHAHEIDHPRYYINRELSWLDFNLRVIEEAYDENNPFLEQLKFLAIGSSNLDEFMMVRVSGVYDQYLAGVEISENKTLMTPDQLLQAISDKNHEIVARQYQRFHELLPKMEELGYNIMRCHQLEGEYRDQLHQYFQRMILPTITPLGVDAYRPFPFIVNNNINIFVQLNQSGQNHYAIVPIPQLLDRFMIDEFNGQKNVIFIEDLTIAFIDELFPGYQIAHAFPFRITRNADFTIVEDGAIDLLELIEDYVKKRRNGMAVRLEVDTRYHSNFEHEWVQFLQEKLDLMERDIYYLNGPLDLTFLFALTDPMSEGHPELQYEPFTPYLNPEYIGESLFEKAKQHDLFFNHPYDSFDPIVSLVEHAAADSKTIAIKQTLYRVSKDSPIIEALKQAAINGKEVTVLVELKARFDEENNLIWARELEEAGCHVLYGVSELKTHSKITLVVRKEDSRIQRYVHLGTGNYNDKTAKQYTDMGIITTNEGITQDATDFFNFLSGYSDVPEYEHLHVSPFAIRDSLSEYIDEEIEAHKENGNGRIIAKMNSLTDKVLIQKLYEASQAGVEIDLIVRGICCLRPGVPGVSENIRVRSIVGRFLEHSRIYFFNHNDQRHLFLSSADMMTRNMIRRVEIEFPILDKEIEAEIMHILQLQLSDTLKARELQQNGEYTRPLVNEQPLNSQEQQIEEANQKQEQLSDKQNTAHNLSWLASLFRRFKNNFLII